MQLSYDFIRTKIWEPMFERHGWDYANEYGEPGYSTSGDTPVLILGDFWCRCGKHPRTGQRKPVMLGHGELFEAGDLHGYEAHHPRLWAQLEAQGVETLWHDEWTVHNGKAWRTTADSHSWVPSYVYTDGDIITTDDDITEWVEWALNDPGRALLHHSEQDIEPLGFIQWPDDDTYYETGWHPHQTDDPQQVILAIQAEHPDDDVIFIINGVGQFDARWTAYRRPREVNA